VRREKRRTEFEKRYLTDRERLREKRKRLSPGVSGISHENPTADGPGSRRSTEGMKRHAAGLLSAGK
jgi:hypothetical protein